MIVFLIASFLPNSQHQPEKHYMKTSDSCSFHCTTTMETKGPIHPQGKQKFPLLKSFNFQEHAQVPLIRMESKSSLGLTTGFAAQYYDFFIILPAQSNTVSKKVPETGLP